jgi:hypothetical protein
MTPAERLAEIAAILGRGFVRSHFLDHEPVIAAGASANEISAKAPHEDGNPLAVPAAGAPSCSHAVNARENEEVA